jgi:hypothetical protein
MFPTDRCQRRRSATARPRRQVNSRLADVPSELPPAPWVRLRRASRRAPFSARGATARRRLWSIRAVRTIRHGCRWRLRRRPTPEVGKLSSGCAPSMRRSPIVAVPGTIKTYGLDYGLRGALGDKSPARRDGRADECDGLENRWATSLVGSNPTPSAAAPHLLRLQQVRGGPARSVGMYSSSWMRPSKVRLLIMSRATSG